MLKSIFPLGLAALLGACSYVDEYERHVHGWEPTYCYQSIGGVECFRTPYHRDERRLVNYFGPHPSRFDKPEPPEPAPHSPPGMVNYWVKDPEPIPRPAPQASLAQLPWLDPAVAQADADRVEFSRVNETRAGTEALLKHMGIGPYGEVKAIAARPPMAKPADGMQVSVRPAAVALEQPAPPAQPLPPVVEVPVN